MLLAKQIISLRDSAHNGHIGERSAHDAIIESFWREYNTTVKDYFSEQFKYLERLGMLKTTENFDV